MNYQSTKTFTSQRYSGVEFTIRRVSFGRRLELASRVRNASQALEFQKSGSGASDAIDASLTVGAIERLCLEWAVESVRGLVIDGEPADLLSLLEQGPEDLTREILDAIRSECGLSGEERKN